MNTHQSLIKREFHSASGLQVIAVNFTDDETIHVTIDDGERFTMQIGSDDDHFEFVNDQGTIVIAFPFPTDWAE